VYRPTQLPPADLDLLEIALKAPLATLSLASALARHELIDEIPSRIDIALPRGHRAPTTSAPIEWHQFDKATFELGRSTTPIDGTDHVIGLFSPERSIVDAFRMRRTIGYETPNEALKGWLRRPGSQPAALLSIAMKIPRSMGPLRQALEILT
jgi:predicted transcriptional regulator of viral defense system